MKNDQNGENDLTDGNLHIKGGGHINHSFR